MKSFALLALLAFVVAVSATTHFREEFGKKWADHWIVSNSKKKKDNKVNGSSLLVNGLEIKKKTKVFKHQRMHVSIPSLPSSLNSLTKEKISLFNIP